MFNDAHSGRVEVVPRTRTGHSATLFAAAFAHAGRVEGRSPFTGPEIGAVVTMSEEPDDASRTVVVVDDDFDIRETVAAIVREAGYPVRVAANGREALDVLSVLPHPGVILMDLTMPVMDGSTLMANLAADPKLASIPLVIMTTVPRNSKPMPKRVLPKPLELDSLLEIVREHCGAIAE
jgi:CheY-like chemotaxis protein